MTRCDALDKDAEPIVVRERSGTQDLKPGEMLGCRIMRVGDHFQMSGAAYLFTLLTGPRVLSMVREHDQNLGQQLDAPREMGLLIMLQWLQHWLKPAPMPTLIDHYSGDPMKMVTDHYRVDDELALARLLVTQSDVEGDRQEGGRAPWTARMDRCAPECISILAKNRTNWSSFTEHNGMPMRGGYGLRRWWVRASRL